MKKANMLLLLANPKYKQVYAKVFDYIALNRKILLVTNDKGNIESFLKHTNSGVFCDDQNDVYNSLIKYYNEFLENKYIENTSVNIEEYSREKQTEKFANIINNNINQCAD